MSSSSPLEFLLALALASACFCFIKRFFSSSIFFLASSRALAASDFGPPLPGDLPADPVGVLLDLPFVFVGDGVAFGAPLVLG